MLLLLAVAPDTAAGAPLPLPAEPIENTGAFTKGTAAAVAAVAAIATGGDTIEGHDVVAVVAAVMGPAIAAAAVEGREPTGAVSGSRGS